MSLRDAKEQRCSAGQKAAPGKLHQTAAASLPQSSLLLPPFPPTRKLFHGKLPKYHGPPPPAHLQMLPRAFNPAKWLRARGQEPRWRWWHFSLATFGRMSAASLTLPSAALSVPAPICLQEFTELLAKA